MSGWLRFENSTAENPKLVPLSDRAFRLWFNACCYCSRNETDGLVPKVIAARLSRTATFRTVEELVAAGRFEPVDETHFYVHDYLDYNPSKARVSEMKEATRERIARWREKQPGNANGNALHDRQSSSRGMRDRSVDVPSSLSSATMEEPQNSAREADKHPEAARLAQLLADLVRQRDSKAKVSPGSDAWVRDMRLLIADRDGDVAEVERVVRWSQADHFWQGVILSPRKLREKFTQLLLKSQRGSGNGRRETASDWLRAMDGAA